MSKDLITILIVLFCIAALIFLIVKTVNLSSNEVSQPGEDYNYLYDDSADGGAVAEDTTGFPETDTESASTAGQEGTQSSVEYVGKDEIATGEASIPTSFDHSGDYLVIAGSFRFKANAESEANRLRRLGYNDAEVALFNRGAYASVIVSRFSDLSSAQDLVRELKSRHSLEAYVQAKKEGEN